MKAQNNNAYLLTAEHQKQSGYQWWWHRFTAHHRDTKEAKNFFVQYLILNPDLGSSLPQFIQDNEQPAYAAITVGMYGEHSHYMTQYYGTEEFQGNNARMQVIIGDNYADDTALFGEIDVRQQLNPQFVSGEGQAIWNLRVNKRLSYNPKYQQMPLLKKAQHIEMDWHVEGMYTEYAGTISYQGEIYDVVPSTSYGYQDTNWGSDFSNPWISISCNNFKNPVTGIRANLTSLAVGGGRLGTLNRTLERKVLIAFSHHGKLYEYNFSKLLDKVKQNVSCVETEETIEWQIVATNRSSKIEVQFSCPKSEMIHLQYENPQGKVVYEPLWSGATAVGTVKLYELKEKEYKLIAHFEGSDAECEYGRHE